MKTEIKCKICGSLKIRAKELCAKCYSKERRKRPDVKLEVKRYNDSEKAKESRKKWVLKQPKNKIKIPNPNKIIKYCNCGKIAVCKGLCFNCYQKNRKIKLGWVPKKRGRKGATQKDVKFNIIVKMVEDGFTISGALKKININRTLFYKNISPIQKQELNSYKALNTLDKINLRY